MISFYAPPNPPPRKAGLKRADDTTHLGGTAGREPSARQMKLPVVGSLSAVEGEMLAYEKKARSLIIVLNYSVFTNIKTMD